LKAIFLLACIVCSIVVVPIEATTLSEFGYNLHPGKLLENTTGTLQIFAASSGMMVPRTIDGFKVTSADNSIIQIIGIQEGSNGYIKNVQIKALKPGSVDIVLAAPGFVSKEISLQVFNNNSYPTQIMMKVTPNDFPIDGPRHGYVSVELATTAGLPTTTSEDLTVFLETPNTNVIKLKESEITIKKNEYFALTEFTILNSGDAVIFASSPGMKKVSETLNVRKPVAPLQVQLQVIPKYYNSYDTTTGYAIAQLLDGDGLPVKAEEDIRLKLGVENPTVISNKSHNFDEIQFDNNEIVIKKGTYSAYTTFTPRPSPALMDKDTYGAYAAYNPKFVAERLPVDGKQTYDMFVSTSNYLTKGDSFTIYYDMRGILEGKGASTTIALPFLTTGDKEIIAVTYFETEAQVSRNMKNLNEKELVVLTIPVKAKSDYQLNFASSEISTVEPINTVVKKGQNALLIFGNTGVIAPDEGVTFYITDHQGVKSVAGLPIGPIKDNLSLVLEPLVSKILVGRSFPVIGYMTESADGTTSTDKENSRLGVTPFIENSILSFSANDFVDADSQRIQKNQPYVLLNMMSEKIGSTLLAYQAGQFKGSTQITSYTTDPTKMHLSYMTNLLTDTNSLATVQLLDSVENPVYAKNDISVKLVSNNESVLRIPDEIIIKKGEYFNTFEIKTLGEGKADLTLLAEDLPMSEYKISIVDLRPTLSMSLPTSTNWNERLEVKLSVSMPKMDIPLDGFSVKWDARGGQIIRADETTATDGTAYLHMIANEKETINVSAIVSGHNLNSASIAKTTSVINIPVEQPPEVAVVETEHGFTLDSYNMFYIIAPAVVGATFIVLKRTDRLGIITERVSFGDRLNMGVFEGVKERIARIRNQ
jgi:hypothetical protein